MFNKDEKIHKRSIKKIDTIVTGMLLGGIVASIYGIKKTNDRLEEEQKLEKKMNEGQFRKILKMLIFGVKKDPVVEKKGFFSRLFKK